MRQGAKTAIVSAIAAAMLGAGGYGAYSLFGSDSKSTTAAPPKPRTVVAESPAPDLAASGAKSFLAAWSSGDLQGAAKLTDDPQAALAALTAFQQQVKPSAVTLTPGQPATAAAFASATAQPSGAAKASPSAAPSGSASASASPSASAAPASQVLLNFKSHVEFAGTTNTWDYTGYLGMVKMSDGTAAVNWAPTVINPHLGAGEQIVTQPVFNPPTRVTDRNGQSLANFPSLSQILLNFQQNPPAQDPADAGTGVAIVDAAGKNKPEPLFTVTDPKPGKPIKLTIDANLEAAAQKAVDEQLAKDPTHKAGMVAIEPSTGNVLAVANAPATGFNTALQGKTAPGSTMKVITATALLEAGVDPNATMPCPSTINTGTTYHNDFTDEEPNNTFIQDFTVSCNTAFIKQGLASLQSGSLAKEAADVFGIGPGWKIGFPTADGSIPGPGQSKDETAGEFMGQGKDLMNPLAMASVAATVESGTFKQPILMAGLPQTPAARQLSPTVLNNLRSMMNQVVTNPKGTATPAMGGISGTLFGGKTGTAEVSSDPKAPTNSWFTGYRDNLAVCAEVLSGGFGADSAAPAVAEVLKIGNAG
ncbi:penicillin-binding transpeptidase domain-containing protein [Kitasatospora sp. NBC_01287]|uniref:penicillin-binding transpeptidase domain-containing protein n=1 Tax=Kitasatospora sp. NBC_01287 TaxID=2903573 RepID=UPI002259F08A|nr:penicillin-binding transpeptidase domain-containing protein [Kitasatospora sp. NBC_01287]MCX4747140.1 penicillin-binding transpeptidase domain-containing protein [Kitasatospora sp. NBC_01287]